MSAPATVAEMAAVFDTIVTQERFAGLVGITQPSVSDLMARGVINVGDTAGVWLRAYCDHLRDVAAGRDPDGQLAGERTRLASEQADRIAMANARYRSENVPIALLEFVLANIVRQMVRQLEGVLPRVLQRYPQLVGEPRRYIEEQLAAARAAASSATFNAAVLEVDLEDQDDEAAPP